MKQGIEKNHRTSQVEVVTGLDEKKVKDVIGTVTHRNGQIGKTKTRIEVMLTTVQLSIKEMHHIASKLSLHHGLRIVATKPQPLWHGTYT